MPRFAVLLSPVVVLAGTLVMANGSRVEAQNEGALATRPVARTWTLVNGEGAGAL